jgi:hypothetical protein
LFLKIDEIFGNQWNPTLLDQDQFSKKAAFILIEWLLMQMMKKQLLCRLHLYPHLFLKKARMLGAIKKVLISQKNKKNMKKQQKYRPHGVSVQQFTNRFWNLDRTPIAADPVVYMRHESVSNEEKSVELLLPLHMQVNSFIHSLIIWP